MNRLPADRRTRLSRRALLRAATAAGVGASALALVGCGEDGDEDAVEQPPDEQAPLQTPATTPPETPTVEEAAPDEAAPVLLPPNPVQGGIIGWPAQVTYEGHDRWDPHRSRYSETQTWLSTMYSRLIRWESISRGTLEADLAATLPEIPDEVTYIFRVNPAARFWETPPMEGRSVTAEDVRFTIQRQIEARDAEDLPDPFFFRQAAYTRTATLEVSDEHTIRLSTEEPDATYLTNVHAGPWAWIIGAEAAEEFGDDWRDAPDDPSLNAGSGPYLPAGFSRDNSFQIRRSANWWKPDLPIYPEGWTFVHVDAATAAAAYRDGRIDAVDFPLGKAAIDELRADFPHHTAYERPIQSAIQLGMVFDGAAGERNPLADARLARAMHLAIDRFELIDALYFGDGRLSGPIPWFFPEWAIPEADLLEAPGYRPDKADDRAEINALVSAAGGAAQIGRVPLVVPDIFQGIFPGIADTIQAMLERNLGLAIDIDFLTYDALFTGVREKTVAAFIGLGPLPLQQSEADPSSHWLDIAHSEGGANWGGYSNPAVDELIEQMRSTFDASARRTRARQIQQHFLDDPFWLVNITNGIQIGIARPYLFTDERALEFAWSAHHFDKSWIDSSNPEYPESRTLPADVSVFDRAREETDAASPDDADAASGEEEAPGAIPEAEDGGG